MKKLMPSRRWPLWAHIAFGVVVGQILGASALIAIWAIAAGYVL